MLAQPQQLPWIQQSIASLEKELAAKYGEGQTRFTLTRPEPVAEFWHAEDGSAQTFEEFVRQNYAGDVAAHNILFERFENASGTLDGHMHEIGRVFRQQADLDLGPMLPVDEVLAGYDPSAHLSDDLFQNKIAFVVLSQFSTDNAGPAVSDGAGWTRPAMGRSPSGRPLFKNRVPPM